MSSTMFLTQVYLQRINSPRYRYQLATLGLAGCLFFLCACVSGMAISMLVVVFQDKRSRNDSSFPFAGHGSLCRPHGNNSGIFPFGLVLYCSICPIFRYELCVAHLTEFALYHSQTNVMRLEITGFFAAQNIRVVCH